VHSWHYDNGAGSSSCATVTSQQLVASCPSHGVPIGALAIIYFQSGEWCGFIIVRELPDDV
jgi:hypothetical protein